MTIFFKISIFISLVLVFSACAVKKSNALACYKGDSACIAHTDEQASSCTTCFVVL